MTASIHACLARHQADDLRHFSAWFHVKLMAGMRAVSQIKVSRGDDPTAFPVSGLPLSPWLFKD